MGAVNSISADKLVRLIGILGSPALIDAQTDEDFAADPRLIPGAVRRDFRTVSDWGRLFAGRKAVVICQKGQKLSEGVAAWLRHDGVQAESLDGGALARAAAGHPMVPTTQLPKKNAQGQTAWATRARPKVDRIACPWLIRRFVDPDAVFLFVAAAEVLGVAGRFAATPIHLRFRHIVRGARLLIDRLTWC
jgi:rhodanese-related sulfurtransferase